MKPHYKKILYFFAAILMVIGISACKKEEPQATSFVPMPSLSPSVEPEPPASFTTGLPLREGHVYQPVMLMIENSKAARPQASLLQADVIYEAIAEGNITRFLCLYNDEIPTYAGPCRSLRIYFLNLHKEWDTILVHYGGPQKLGYAFSIYGENAAHIKGRVDGVKGDHGYFTRIPERVAPHNAYTDLTVIQQKFGTYTPKERTSWQFSETPPYESYAPATKIGISFLSKNSNFVEFVYNEAENVYYRFQEGAEFTTITKTADASVTTQMHVKNLIIQYAEQGLYPEKAANNELRKVNLTGRGNAEYFINGKHIKGHWERATLDDATEYFDDAGNPIVLLPGNTWVALHPDNKPVTVSS